MSSLLRQRIQVPYGHRLGLVGVLWLLPWFSLSAQPGPAKVQTAAPEHCEQNPACRKLLLQARKYSAGGRYEQAVAVFLEALKRTEQRDVRLYMDLGRAYHLWGRISEAVNAYNRYLKSVPPDTPGRDIVLRWLSDALMSEGQPDPAAESALHPKPAAPPAPVAAPAPASPEPPRLAQAPSPPPEPPAPAPRLPTVTQLALASEPSAPLPASHTQVPPTRCPAEALSTNQKLLIAGSTVAGAGLLGLIPSAWALNRDVANGETCDHLGKPVPCALTTKVGYVSGFVLSGIGISVGVAMIAWSAKSKPTRKLEECAI